MKKDRFAGALRTGMVAALITTTLFAVVSLAGSIRSNYPIQPVSFMKVEITDTFWNPRVATNRDVTVPYCFLRCEETGRIRNFEVAGSLRKGGFEGLFFNDSDVYKVIEGASYALAQHSNPELDTYLDVLIAKIAAAQEDDGYIYTARSIGDQKYDYPGKEARWSNLRFGHELYNAGHLYEAAVAHYQATGKRTLLDVAVKSADLVCAVFGKKKRPGFPGHEEIEIGLIKLYRVTGDKNYLEQARLFVSRRGHKEHRENSFWKYAMAHRSLLRQEYAQAQKPIEEQSRAVGHAVRAGYFYAGVADVAALTNDRQYMEAIDKIWNDLVSKKLYLTGGIGSRQGGEAFGGNYELPNATAYNETCASVANALFNYRMFLLHGRSDYVDVLERILYNGFLSGVSFGGDRFFYANPLSSAGNYSRSPWFACSCCPVNIVRFIPSISAFNIRLYLCRKR